MLHKVYMIQHLLCHQGALQSITPLTRHCYYYQHTIY